VMLSVMLGRLASRHGCIDYFWRDGARLAREGAVREFRQINFPLNNFSLV